mgnify:FL=1
MNPLSVFFLLVIILLVFCYFWIVFIDKWAKSNTVVAKFELILIYGVPLILGLILSTTFPIHLLV